jgi:hypothetical protein
MIQVNAKTDLYLHLITGLPVQDNMLCLLLILNKKNLKDLGLVLSLQVTIIELDRVPAIKKKIDL